MAPDDHPRPKHLFTGLGVFLGNRFFLAEEEGSAASVQKRKRKKKKKNHLQPEHLGSGTEAMPPEQNGGGEPGAGAGRAPKTAAAEPGTAAAPGPQEQSGAEPAAALSRRKRPRKRSPGVQGGSEESASPPPLEDTAPGGPGSAHAQDPAPRAAPASRAPVPKRKRKLGALPVNGSGTPVLAWPPPPGGRLKKKKGEPGSLELYGPSSQKAAILKKRKRLKEMSKAAACGGVSESEAMLIQALVRQPAPIYGAGVRGQARAPDRGAGLVCDSLDQRGNTRAPLAGSRDRRPGPPARQAAPSEAAEGPAPSRKECPPGRPHCCRATSTGGRASPSDPVPCSFIKSQPTFGPFRASSLIFLAYFFNGKSVCAYTSRAGVNEGPGSGSAFHVPLWARGASVPPCREAGAVTKPTTGLPVFTPGPSRTGLLAASSTRMGRQWCAALGAEALGNGHPCVLG